MAINVIKWNQADIKWNNNSHLWNLVQEVIAEVAAGGKNWRKRDKDKKKRLIRLICRVKGEKVYDEEKEVGEVDIKLEDAELVVNEVLGKIKVEKADVLYIIYR